MSKEGSKLLYLAIGAAVGAAIGYIAASDKKEEWFNDIHSLVDKVKCNARSAASKGKEKLEDLKSEISEELSNDAK